MACTSNNIMQQWILFVYKYVKSKVQSELLKEQIITNAKTEEIKQELDVSKNKIVSNVSKQNNKTAEKVNIAKQHIIDATSDKPLTTGQFS